MMNVVVGCSYHIKDDFFSRVQDESLMVNKDGGGYRPHFYCLEDDEVGGLYWVIPVSTKVDKFRPIMNKKVAKYGKCNTIMIGLFGGKESAFLIQNMFPIIANYFDHVHTINNIPVRVHSDLAKEIDRNAKDVLSLNKKGIRILFTDVEKIKRIMISELYK
jgi:hypothetical protein